MAASAKPGPYHHGQLREALLNAALELARERGLQSVSLREVARLAGVSHAAPYHHFPDKAALLTALTVRGFERLAESLRTAANAAGDDDLARLLAAGVAYVAFALRDPATFRLMFRPELRDETGVGTPSAAIVATGQATFGVLLELVAAGQASGRIRPGPLTDLALTAWSATHGLATLLVDGAPGWALLEPAATVDTHSLASRIARLILEGLQVPEASASR